MMTAEERVAGMKEISALYVECDESVVEPVRRAIVREIEEALAEQRRELRALVIGAFDGGPQRSDVDGVRASEAS